MQKAEFNSTRKLWASGMICAALLVCGVGTGYFVYCESAEGRSERAARAHGCTCCHGEEDFRQVMGCLQHLRPGQDPSPLLRKRLLEEHPVLSSGAEDELTEWLLSRQIPALLRSRSHLADQALYRNKCAACHGNNGEGKPGSYPPLMGSEWITEEPGRLPEILRDGLSGPITVKGQPWDGVMLPPGIPDDATAERIIRYLRKTMVK